MNEVLLKSVLKMAKNFISPEQIKEAAKGLINQAVDYKSDIPLETGEAHAIGIIYEVKGVVYVAVAMLNAENHILRFEKLRPINEVIDALIKKI